MHNLQAKLGVRIQSLCTGKQPRMPHVRRVQSKRELLQQKLHAAKPIRVHSMQPPMRSKLLRVQPVHHLQEQGMPCLQHFMQGQPLQGGAVHRHERHHVRRVPELHGRQLCQHCMRDELQARMHGVRPWKVYQPNQRAGLPGMRQGDLRALHRLLCMPQVRHGQVHCSRERHVV